jgi:phthiocerol/phenolphthiocerol synthesis type-I polyketide synthase E
MSQKSFTPDVAITGMALTVPGARSVAEFWKNLVQGRESVAWFSPQEMESEGIPPELFRQANYVPAKGMVEGIEYFDAEFFGYTPSEADVLDPQQRLFIQHCWLALEDANCNPKQFQGRIGVFGCAGASSYLINNLLPRRELRQQVGEYRLLLANDKDFLATRVAYKFDLTGPAYTIQSGCSSSLLAVHVACQSILNGECDLALAGGVAISLPQKNGYLFQPEMISSPDGHCRPFDERAQGTVRGDGVGIVILKPLQHALRENDIIYAVIKGSAINNDGAHKMGFTAPSVSGQATVIREALEIADFRSSTVDFVETHGTGTMLGDPVEFAALREAFSDRPANGKKCALGAVKANIGHLDTAAGIVGLIKASLALAHRAIPPASYFNRPNPALHLETSPFYFNTELQEWPAGTHPRRAGVSSFGVGGTNIHVALEEAPAFVPQSYPAETFVIIVSAGSETALRARVEDLRHFLDENPGVSLPELACTLQTCRQSMKYRVAFVASSLEDVKAKLGSLLDDSVAPATASKVVFAFSDFEVESLPFAFYFYSRFPVFRKAFDRCSAILGRNLQQYFSAAASAGPEQMNLSFAVQWAFTQTWKSFGIEPLAAIGSGGAEILAGCLAGVFPLESVPVFLGGAGSSASFAADDRLKPPTLHLVSTVPPFARLGAEAETLDYWFNVHREKEHFAKRARQFLENPDWQLLNVMPGQTFNASPASTDSPWTAVLSTLAQLWTKGCHIGWEALYPDRKPRRIKLPVYRFDQVRHWIEAYSPQEESRSPSNSSNGTQPAAGDELIRELWSTVLGNPNLGVNDNFFDLGADSLHVLRFLDLFKAQSGRQLSTTTVFENPTITKLTVYINAGYDVKDAYRQVNQMTVQETNVLKNDNLVL